MQPLRHTEAWAKYNTFAYKQWDRYTKAVSQIRRMTLKGRFRSAAACLNLVLNRPNELAAQTPRNTMHTFASTEPIGTLIIMMLLLRSLINKS